MSFISAITLWYSLSVYVADFTAILPLTGVQRVILLISTLAAITFIETIQSEE